MENSVNNQENSPSYTEPEADKTSELTDETPVSTDDGASAKGAESSEQSMEDFMEMYEESLKQFEEGEVVTGTIISVDKDFVLVDVGYKSEGQIPISEFLDETGKVDVKLNDRVEVMVEFWDEEGERVVLSKEKAAKVKVWEQIKEIYDADGTIEGVIVTRVKGGFSVDVGVQAFLPGSQADLRPIRNLDDMVGQTFEFKILKFNRKRNNIVLSRRVLLEAEREGKRAATLAAIEEGAVIEGTVKNITEYGIFVDLGGVDGLLHITDISWGRVKHPSELYAIGDPITVKILSFDKENERVSLGMKQLVPDPWSTAKERYPIGSKITGKVVSLTDYGAFVEVEEGIEGLIHVSEMSWTRKIRHPSKVVSAGEEIEAVVLDIKPESRRISLGMKQLVPNPWEMISEKYPVGSTIEGRVKNITDFGIFIGIDDDIDGLVHISDISWIKRIKHPSELYKKGDVIQARVLDIDIANERFSLGIKQLSDDPWKTVSDRYPVGTEISGTITNVTDFGIFVELEEGIEGLVHVSEISKEKVKTPVGLYAVGDSLTAKVMHINTADRRIGLSIKRLEADDEQTVLEEYVTKVKPAPSSFGEILQQNLKEKLNGLNGQAKASAAQPEPDETAAGEVAEAPVKEAAESPAPSAEAAVEEEGSDISDTSAEHEVKATAETDPTENAPMDEPAEVVDEASAAADDEPAPVEEGLTAGEEAHEEPVEEASGKTAVAQAEVDADEPAASDTPDPEVDPEMTESTESDPDRTDPVE